MTEPGDPVPRRVAPGADLRTDLATRVTAEYPLAHGAPLHAGDPPAIGIADVARPDFGEAIAPLPDEAPVFWACGVTPQAVLMAVRPEFVITHAPGHMFVTDVKDAAIRGRRSISGTMGS